MKLGKLGTLGKLGKLDEPAPSAHPRDISSGPYSCATVAARTRRTERCLGRYLAHKSHQHVSDALFVFQPSAYSFHPSAFHLQSSQFV